ncbi:MAG: hypothetical protein ACOCSF_01130 [Halanaeroarchaeum sp.]
MDRITTFLRRRYPTTTEPTFGHLTEETLGLFTDLFEIRMIEGYLAAGRVPRRSERRTGGDD